MPLSIFLLEIVGLLALACISTGRALAATFGVRWLMTRRLENVAASAFLGTAFFFLAFGWFSYMGWPARPAALGVGALWSALVAALAYRKRFGAFLPWRGDASGLFISPLPRNSGGEGLGVRGRNPGKTRPLSEGRLTPSPQPSPPEYRGRGRNANVANFKWQYGRLALAGFAAAAIFMLPLFLGNSYLLVTDFKHYANGAEYLQRHGFGTPATVDEDFQSTVTARDFQNLNHRMGPIFFLAFVESLIPGSSALELIPAVTAWGLILNVLSVYLLCRWAVRLDEFCSWACALLVGIGANPLQFSAEYGFVCQIYGTAALGFCLAILSRAAAPCRRTRATAFVLAAGAAFLVSAYGELAPFLLLAGLGFGIRSVTSARRRQALDFLRFTGLTFLFLALIANVEIARSARAILTMMNVHGVGWHVPLSTSQYAAFGLGVEPYKFYAAPANLFLLLPVSFFFVLGLGRATLDDRAAPLCMAVWVFMPLVAYFRWWAHDPWTHEVGHTWNLFKLCQWLFPFTVVLQMAGLRAVLPRPTPRRLVVNGFCLLLVILSAPRHWKEAKFIGSYIQSAFCSSHPLDDMRNLRREMDELGRPPLYLMHPSTENERMSIYATILPDVAFRNGWTNAPGRRPNEYAPEQLPPDTRFVMHGTPLFEPPLKRLPAGLALVDPRHAFILGMTKKDAVAMALPKNPTDLDAAPVKMILWSPKAARARLDLDFEPGPARPQSAGRRIRFAIENETPQEIDIDCGRTTSLPLVVQPGINIVHLQCLDQPLDAAETPKINSRTTLLRLSQAQFTLNEE